jgi:hypothetical protein
MKKIIGSHSDRIKSLLPKSFQGRVENHDSIILVQGGSEDIKPFFLSHISLKSPSFLKEGEHLLLLNCARRTGSVEIQQKEKSSLYFLPMEENSAKKSSKTYCETYMKDWKTVLGGNGIVVVNCQEGLHRSVDLLAAFKKSYGLSA